MSILHAAARRIEKWAARAQGKGYGTATIDAEIRAALSLLGRKPDLAIDIGANEGLYTAGLRRRVPGLEVHLFEPSATNVARLTTRFSGETGLTVNALAVGDKDGEAVLYADRPGSGMASLSNRDLAHVGLSFSTSEPVRVIRFEQYWTTTLGRRPLDLVKLDIEGHELAALAGFGPALDAIGVLQFEFGGANIDTRTYVRDFWSLLTGRGFSLYRITPFGPQAMTRYRESDEFFSTTNFLAVRR